jgi:ribosome-binding protein aMBF1 (putative translation factor)
MTICQPEAKSNKTYLQNPTHSMPVSVPQHVGSRFGARLRQLRHERGLTQRGMAMRFGIDRSFISDVERGQSSISLHTLEVMALGLNLSLSELLSSI